MAVHQLSKAEPDGVSVGQSAADKVSLHGATPVVQAAAITNIANDANGTAIATAVNGILAALRGKGVIAT
jgi:hypothetical protein